MNKPKEARTRECSHERRHELSSEGREGGGGREGELPSKRHDDLEELLGEGWPKHTKEDWWPCLELHHTLLGGR